MWFNNCGVASMELTLHHLHSCTFHLNKFYVSNFLKRQKRLPEKRKYYVLHELLITLYGKKCWVLFLVLLFPSGEIQFYMFTNSHPAWQSHGGQKVKFKQQRICGIQNLSTAGHKTTPPCLLFEIPKYCRYWHIFVETEFIDPDWTTLLCAVFRVAEGIFFL